MISDASKTESEHLIAIEWTISEDRLRALKNSIKFEFLVSKTFNVIHASDVKYWLVIHPNGDNSTNLGKSMIFLNIMLGKEKKIESEYTFSIKSAEWSQKINYALEEDGGYGCACCTVDELFDPKKKFIVEGKFVVKIGGILKTEKEEPNCTKEIQEANGKTNFSALWDSGFEDFTIITDGNEIKIHKCVIARQSTVFEAMFQSTMKEAIENKVEIPEFPFRIVEKAIKLCYHQMSVSNISLDDSFLLLKFMDKYDIAALKDNLEAYLANELTPSNVCGIVKNSSDGNALCLRNKCIDFITDCIAQKKPVKNMELLDKEFMVIVLSNLACNKYETL